jgi:CYTH domain-containing protein
VNQPETTSKPLEIERVYLLDRLPELPATATSCRIEQGYMPDDEVEGEEEDGFLEGRLRRKTDADGAVRCFLTIKRGAGLVREEEERSLTRADFEAGWGRTEGRRITKTRHKVREGELTWEIDDFDGLDLVMAEVELPAADTRVDLPSWLVPRVLRELTDDPRYRNYALATQGLPPDHPG